MKNSNLDVTNVRSKDVSGHMQTIEEDPMGVLAAATSLVRHTINPVLADGMDAVIMAAAVCALAYEIKTEDALYSEGRSVQLRCFGTFIASSCVTMEQRKLFHAERATMIDRVVQAMVGLLKYRRVWACVEQNVVVRTEWRLCALKDAEHFTDGQFACMVSCAHFLHNLAVRNPEDDVLVLAEDLAQSGGGLLEDAFVLCCRLAFTPNASTRRFLSSSCKHSMRRAANTLVRNVLRMTRDDLFPRQGVYADPSHPVGRAVSDARLRDVVVVLNRAHG